ncbi:hypothetical protein D3C80_612850 [compost metagenome]
MQQAGKGRRHGKAAIGQALVDRLQLMGQIADGTHAGHPCPPLEGVQVALQRGQRRARLRLGQPVLEGFGGTVEDVTGFLEEYLDHFRIGCILADSLLERCHRRSRDIGERRDSLDGFDDFESGWLHLGLKPGFGIEYERQFSFCGSPGFGFRPGLCGCAGLGFRPGLCGCTGFGFRPGLCGCTGFRFRLRRGIAQQLVEGLHTLRLRAHLETGGHLIHHADQRFVGGLGFAEEGLVNGQARFAHRVVGSQQSGTEQVDLRQVGLSCAVGQSGQFVTQGIQLHVRGRMQAPARQQVVGVQQDIHAVGEELADQLGIAVVVVAPAGFGGIQLLLMQLLHPLQQGRAIGQTGQGRATELLQAVLQHPFGIAQQFGGSQTEGNQIGLELLGQLLQGRRHFGDRQDAGHVGAALEGVQGALQFVGDRLWQLAIAGGEEVRQRLEMRFGFGAEDLQQLRIEQLIVVAVGVVGHGGSHRRQCRFGHGGARQRLPVGQRVGRRRQLVDIVALALGLAGILLDQRRQEVDHLADQLQQRRVGLDAAIDDPVEHVLDRPGQLANHQGTDHAATALEGVEGPAYFGERLAVAGIG